MPRMRFQGQPIRFRDDTETGEIDESANEREEAELILSNARARLKELGFECDLSYSRPGTSQRTLTADTTHRTHLEQFIEASDKRHGREGRTADLAALSKMTPIERFLDGVKRKYGEN